MKKQVLLTVDLFSFLTIHDSEAASLFIAQIVSKGLSESPVTAEFGQIDHDGKWIADPSDHVQNKTFAPDVRR